MRILEWDTAFFGHRIARAAWPGGELAPLRDRALAAGVDCLYVVVPRADPAQIQHAVACGGRLVSIRTALALDGEAAARPAVAGARLAAAADTPQLLQAADALARTSRFAADPRFASAKVRAMYHDWIQQCLAQGVVAVPDGDGVGIVAARPRLGVAQIELVYVHPDAAGRGLGRTLLAHALRSLGATTARVATQAGNVAAIRLYESAGFRTSSVDAILHLWLDDMDVAVRRSDVGLAGGSAS